MKLTPRLPILLLVGLILLLVGGSSPVSVAAQDNAAANCPSDTIDAETLFACMDVGERIGQLFLVSFVGSDARPESNIADLIENYHIGGVVLDQRYDNLNDSVRPAVENLSTLTEQLQALALTDVTNLDVDGIEGDIVAVPRLPLPLLIALSQEGHEPPSAAILNGLTPPPNPLAIGATWSTANAEAVGQYVGAELASAGVNMLLGPNLNVLEPSGPADSADLGSRSFGGDPYWVGALAQNYIRGLQQGSDGRLLVVGKHLPNYAGSDIESGEIATVRKSLTQLQEFDLLPFFEVVNSSETVSTTVDALLTTHIRFQGFAGNIRDTTPPVSVSQGAQAELFALPALAAWRAQGGVVVSDALGAPALQNFYDDEGLEFPHRQVAKDAFAAGNDMLFLGDFALNANQNRLGDENSAEQMANIRDTINWFIDRYDEEPAFQQNVDASVKRILDLKIKLYGLEFVIDNVIGSNLEADSMPDDATAADILVSLPAQAITLISPSAGELAVQIPEPPSTGEKIVIFTDERFVSQCSSCDERPIIGSSALADRMLTLYGPSASNQVEPDNISSFSYADLQAYLAFNGQLIGLPTPEPTSTPAPDPTATPEGFQPPLPTATPAPPPAYFVQEALLDADWVLFAMLDVQPENEVSGALSNFLDRRTNSDASHVIAFAFDAPYYLDSSDILKLSAYYGLFSAGPDFVDAAVRTLFQDLVPSGSSPVSIPGVGYDLFDVTQPDSQQKIELLVVQSSVVSSPPSDEPIDLVGGQSLEIQTGIILDFNGNPVPDGTLVRFVEEDFTESRVNILSERPTTNGIATYTFTLPDEFEGSIRIRANSGSAVLSDEVSIVGNQISVATPTPTPEPTQEPTATAAPTATATPEPTQTPTPSPTPMPSPTPVPEASVNITATEGQALLSVVTGLIFVTVVASGIGRNMLSSFDVQLKLVLWSLFFALLLYNYITLNLPGSGIFDGMATPPRALLSIVTGGSIGIVTYYVFNRSLK